MNLSKATLNLQVLCKLIMLLRQYRFPPEKVKKLQERRLRKLIRHAYTIPFYRDRFDAVGIKPDDIRTPNDLKLLPILTKEEYRSFVQNEIQRNTKHLGSWFKDSTTGSTGKPLTICRTWAEQAYVIAKWLRELILNGYNPLTDTTFCLRSPHLVVKRDSAVQYLGLLRRKVTSFMDPIDQIVDIYEKFKPELFYANKSQFVQMAEYASNKGRSLHRPKLYAVGGETMDDKSKNKIVSVFGEDGFFETYGCVESGNLAFTLKNHNECFNFFNDTTILELDQSEGCDKNTGTAIITDLHHLAFPLIRYNLNDILETEIVHDLITIKKIKGRSNDWVVFEDGERISWLMFYEIMGSINGVSVFRIIQETYEKLRIVAVCENESKKEELAKIIADSLNNAINKPNLDIQVEWVPTIPADENGKIRMLISKIRQ